MRKKCEERNNISFVKEHIDGFSIAYAQRVMSGKWKTSIIFAIFKEKTRFSSIQKQLGKDKLTRGVLSTQLSELESDGIISKLVFPEIPPHVEYSLTAKGKQLIPIIQLMIQFGKDYDISKDINVDENNNLHYSFTS